MWYIHTYRHVTSFPDTHEEAVIVAHRCGWPQTTRLGFYRRGTSLPGVTQTSQEGNLFRALTDKSKHRSKLCLKEWYTSVKNKARKMVSCAWTASLAAQAWIYYWELILCTKIWNYRGYYLVIPKPSHQTLTRSSDYYAYVLQSLWLWLNFDSNEATKVVSPLMQIPYLLCCALISDVWKIGSQLFIKRGDFNWIFRGPDSSDIWLLQVLQD